jgi:hypothetical protein
LQLEFNGSQVSQRAVETSLIVIGPPFFDNLLGLVEAHEPILIQAFIPKLAVEALLTSWWDV